MNEEQVKKMIADDFDNLIKERLDSAIIFKYISNIEKENQNLKEQLEQSIAVSDTNSELAESYYNENQKLKGSIQTHEIILRANVEENQKLKEQKRLILKNIKEWIRCSKSEQLEDDLVHEKYWNSFEQILRNIFNNYNTEHLNDEDLKYKQYLEKENEELKKQLQQKEDIINKTKEHLELKAIRYSNETDYMLDETDLKEIIEILDNKGE